MTNEPAKDQRLIETLPTAFSRHQVVLGDDGNPADYIFLQVNTAFEQMTGLKRDQILGKKVTEVLPGIETSEFDWIGVCGRVALDGAGLNFEHYSEPLKRWYTVQAYSDEPGYFTTVFSEITGAKQEAASIRELLKLTDNLISSDQGTFDYQAAINSLLGLSGAKFAAINTYEEDRTKTVTRAMAGVPAMIKKASAILGFEITGRAWDIQPERLRIIEGGQLIRFRSLFETSLGALNKTTAATLQKLTGIGAVYVLELAYGGWDTIGDIIFFMPKQKEIENREAIELYAGQLGAVLGRLRAEEELLKNEKRLSLAQVNARAGFWEYDIKKETLYWSSECEALFGLNEEEFEGTFDAFLKRVHPEDKEYVISMNQPITGHGEGVPLEYEHRIIKKDGSVLWVRETADTIYDETGEAAFVSGFVMDLTERKQAEEAKDFQLRFQQIAAETSAALVGFTGDAELNWEVNRVLERLGELFATNRSYLFQFSEDLELMSNTHEWCAPGVEAQMENIQNQPTADLPWLKAQILKRKPVHIPDVTALPPEAAAEKRTFASQNIRSLVCLPTVGSKGRLTGFIGFDMVKQAYSWPQEQINMLQLVADTIGGTLERRRAVEALRESELKFRSLTDNLPGVAYRCLYDQDWTMKYMSTDIDRITGYPSIDFLNNALRSYESVIHRKDTERVVEEIEGAVEAQMPWDIEYRVLHRDGTVRWVQEKGQAVKNAQGTVDYLDGLILDINDRKIAEETLVKRLAFEKMIAGVSSNFVNLPPEKIDEGINYALKSVGELFDVDRSYLYRFSEDGKTYTNTHLWCKDGVEGYFEKDQEFPADLTPWWAGEIKSGRIVNIADVAQLPDEAALDRADFLSEEIKSIFTIPLTLEGKVFGCFGFDTVEEQRTWTDEQVDLLQVVAELITGAVARHDADRQIRLLSFHDQLTGLYNRRYFEHELERLDRSREHPIAVVSADLDGLKLVNDTIGHNEGDRYLQAGANLLKSALRASDILARVGGDEFALLLPGTDKAAAELLVKRIRLKIEQYNLEQQGLPLSISLGLAVSTGADYPLEAIYKVADNNMYTDKLQQGKKARAEIVASILASLFERGNLDEGERDQVQELAIRLGQALALPEEHLARLALFAQIYDIGKVGLPDSIIHSSMQHNAGNLSEAEREALRRHPESGYRIASASPDLADVADLVLKHHENYDGSGYPLGLKGTAIPIECRILSVAISYSAMTNPRPYAKTLAPAQALAELKRCAGSQFDPAVVEAFVEMVE